MSWILSYPRVFDEVFTYLLKQKYLFVTLVIRLVPVWSFDEIFVQSFLTPFLRPDSFVLTVLIRPVDPSVISGVNPWFRDLPLPF